MATSDAKRVLSTLADPGLAPLFARPVRFGVRSQWYGHVPFARWLIAAAEPRVVVELGSLAGVSFCAMCEAVKDHGLSSRCFAVDTWQGDDHTGSYGQEIFDSLSAEVADRYPDSARLLRKTFDAALADFADGSVDLLHIDGFHSYDAVRHDFDTWLPKMSDRGVVIFHDTHETKPGFGVWQFWAEVSALYPHFAFAHSHGLGLICTGPRPPEAVRALCALAEPERAAIVDRFAVLGGVWTQTYQESVAMGRFREKSHEAFHLNADRTRQQARAEAAEAERDRARAELAEALRLAGERDADLAQARAQRDRTAKALSRVEARYATATARMEALRASLSWRVTRPLRALRRLVRR